MTKTKFLIVISLMFISNFTFGQHQEIEDLVSKGIELHDKGEYKKAIETYQKALRIDPDSGLINYEIAFSYLSDKDYKNAEIYSKKVIDLQNDHLLLGYITYGNALDMQGKTEEAIKSYEKAMKDFDHYLLYYNHAITCLNSGDTDKAYDSALKAIINNSAHASSHLILSKIMEKKGSRIKAMLPLYFFLLIEPNSNRSGIEYESLRKYIDHGVSQTLENNINIVVPMNNDADFGAAEMMISLSKASNSLEDNKGKSDLELFSENNERLFKILGELKKDNSGFWWDLYVPFFYDMTNENLTKPFSYYISLSKGEEVTKWIDENNIEFEKFSNWIAK
ncbi:tetratricopeptide repeat protein [Maribacter sp. TH_r10]|uniref:tetratricopeptide repeat protein n=1 Tax=Maribacter sp. TH_r10 TaxID=3082086 RepID=UPI00295371AF|nr:tetratricopeptide repeat protein [Maribacter sp. TH_r10]MDV7140415.1 tetratricopeptide repeat protein [Maribacter sp. TH_r10]